METFADVNTFGEDGAGFCSRGKNGSPTGNGVNATPLHPRPKYDPASLNYDMTGDRRLFIFNHDVWCDLTEGYSFRNLPPQRNGSDCDVKSLEDTFGNMKFSIDVSRNLVYNQILDKLKYICELDHRNTSCVAIAVLSHGDYNGQVYAADKPYYFADIITYLQNDRRLAGIPKLFFIQACRGDKTDMGHSIQTDGSSKVIIPTHADCLVMMSTYNEHVSYRKSSGSWMIQALCRVLNDHHKVRDLVHMTTLVHHDVALKISKSTVDSEYNNKKQTIETQYTLTKFMNL